MKQDDGVMNSEEIRSLVLTIQPLQPTERLRRLESLELAGRIAPAMKQALLGLCSSSEGERELKIGSVFGRYTLTDLIGEGGMGRVYEAWDPRMKRNVALKLIRPELLGVTGLLDQEGLGSPEERFESEVEVLGSLQHSGIVSVFDRGFAEAAGGVRIPFCAMEMVEGETLEAYCSQRQLSVEDRLRLLTSLCKAVGYAHSRKVVHRDLKPANVLVDHEGQPRVLDFGIAVTVGRSHPIDLHSLGLGTPAWFAPEQISHEFGTVSYATDVYSLGMIIFYVLSGRMAYQVDSRDFDQVRHILTQSRPPMLGDIDATFRGDIEQIVHRCLQKHSNTRFAHAGALADVLRSCLDKRMMEQLARQVAAQSPAGGSVVTPLDSGQTVAFVPADAGDKVTQSPTSYPADDRTLPMIRGSASSIDAPHKAAVERSASTPANVSPPEISSPDIDESHAPTTVTRPSISATPSTATTAPLEPTSALGDVPKNHPLSSSASVPTALLPMGEQLPGATNAAAPTADLRLVSAIMIGSVVLMGLILLVPTIFNLGDEPAREQLTSLEANSGTSRGTVTTAGNHDRKVPHPSPVAASDTSATFVSPRTPSASDSKPTPKPRPAPVLPPAATPPPATPPPATPVPATTQPPDKAAPPPPPVDPSTPKPSVQELFQLAATDLNNERYEKAIAGFDKVLQLDPNNLNAHLNKGNAYKYLHDYEKAIEAYGEGIKVSPEAGKFYNYRAQTHWQLDRYQECIADATEFIKLEPESSLGYDFRARSLLELNQPQKALEDLNRGIELNPDDRELFLYRSKAYQALGKTEEAERDLKKVRGES